MKIISTIFILLITTSFNAQSWNEYLAISEKKLKYQEFEKAEYNCLNALMLAKNNYGINNDNYRKCINKLINILSLFPEEKPYTKENDSLNNCNIIFYQNNITDEDINLTTNIVNYAKSFKTKFKYYPASQLYLRAYNLNKKKDILNQEFNSIYSGLINSSFNDGNYDLATNIFENQLTNLKKSFTSLKIEDLESFDYIVKSWVKKNDVNKVIEVSTLIENLYLRFYKVKNDNFLNFYNEIASSFFDIDLTSAKYLSEIAYERFKLAIDKNNEKMIFKLFENLSIINNNLKNYDISINYDIESLKYLKSDFDIERIKKRMLDSYCAINNIDKTKEIINQLDLEKNKLDKKSFKYLLYKLDISNIFIKYNKYDEAIPILKELIVIFNSLDNERTSLIDLHNCYFQLSKCYYSKNEIEKSKEFFNKIITNHLDYKLEEDFLKLRKQLESK